VAEEVVGVATNDCSSTSSCTGEEEQDEEVAEEVVGVATNDCSSTSSCTGEEEQDEEVAEEVVDVATSNCASVSSVNINTNNKINGDDNSNEPISLVEMTNELRLQDCGLQLRFAAVHNLNNRKRNYEVYATKAELTEHINYMILVNGAENYESGVTHYEFLYKRYKADIAIPHKISHVPKSPNQPKSLEDCTSNSIDSPNLSCLKEVVQRDGFYGVKVPKDHLCLFHCVFLWLRFSGNYKYDSAISLRQAVAKRMRSGFKKVHALSNRSILQIFIEQEDYHNNTSHASNWKDGEQINAKTHKQFLTMYNNFCKLLEGNSYSPTIHFDNLNEVTFFFLCDVANANMNIHSTKTCSTQTFGPIGEGVFTKTIEVCFTYNHFDVILDFNQGQFHL
jgi:hypothetical protein